MNFEKFGVSENTEHSVKYSAVVNGLGFNKVVDCLPFDLETIKKAIKEDVNLNNLPLAVWDEAAGFRFYGEKAVTVSSKLRDLLRENGITSYSCSQAVCILKECARMLCGEQ